MYFSIWYIIMFKLIFFFFFYWKDRRHLYLLFCLCFVKYLIDTSVSILKNEIGIIFHVLI